MKRFINRLAWRIVRATSERTAPRPQCEWCRRRHRSTKTAADCEAAHLAIMARRYSI
jgi:hypothetical protein